MRSSVTAQYLTLSACCAIIISMTKKTAQTNLCTICGQPYEVKAYRAAASKYCSRHCWSQRHPPDMKTCPTCGQSFSTYQRNQIYCSQSCAGKSRVGPNANAWKDGKSLLRERARESRRLKAWRISVFKRDAYTCQRCGYSGPNLHAHHLQSFANCPALRFDIANGLTLCIDCHGKVHGRNFRPVKQKHRPICKICGKTTKGRSDYCRSCAITLWHQHRRLQRGVE